MSVSTVTSSEEITKNRYGDGTSEHLLSAFSHANALGLAICDERMRYCAVNAALAGFNGVPVECHLGNSLRDILGGVAENVESMFHRVFRTGHQVAPSEVVLKLPTRTEHGHWIITYFPVRSRSAKVTHVGALSVEVTRQRQLESFLQRFNNYVYPSRTKDAHLLSSELRASVDGYHAAVAMTLAGLSRGYENQPRGLSDVVALLDDRLRKMQSVISEVATRFAVGPRG